MRETKSAAQSTKSEVSTPTPVSSGVSSQAFIAHNTPLHRTTPSTSKSKPVTATEHDLVLHDEPLVVLDPYLAKYAVSGARYCDLIMFG